jgi:hypothetical protein
MSDHNCSACTLIACPMVRADTSAVHAFVGAASNTEWLVRELTAGQCGCRAVEALRELDHHGWQYRLAIAVVLATGPVGLRQYGVRAGRSEP